MQTLIDASAHADHLLNRCAQLENEMKGPLAQLMQQAQRMQDDMKRAQEEVAKLEVTGQSGGGMVSVTMNGRMKCGA